jgi:hypothetical protein
MMIRLERPVATGSYAAGRPGVLHAASPPSRGGEAFSGSPGAGETGIASLLLCRARCYFGHTRVLGVYELALPGSVLIAVISLPSGETKMSKVGPGGGRR